MASLIAISRAASNQAKSLRMRRLLLHAGTFVLSIAAMFIPEPFVQLPLVAALLTEGASWVLRHRAGELHALGEEARRLGMAMEGFGEQHESSQAVDLRARVPRALLEAAERIEDPIYYASVLPPGRQRLGELLEESSFWSKHLYRAAAKESFWISGLVGVGLLVAALIAAPFSDASTALVVSRAAVILLGVLISIDEVGTALSWRDAADAASCVSAQIEKLDPEREPLLLTLFSDYSVATATAAPIPQHVYEREKDRLNRLWRDWRASKGSVNQG